MIESAMHALLAFLAVPEAGLWSAFIVSAVSATLVPMGSEPAVFAVAKANAALFWPVLLVATAGNTLGGAIDYWMGMGADQVFGQERRTRWFGWLQRYGARAMLLSWLPGIGDPICVLGGWLRLPFWPCVAYMAAGKFLRYLAMTWLLLGVPDRWWQDVVRLL